MSAVAAPEPGAPQAPAPPPALPLADLRMAPAEQARLLVDRLKAGDALNAFLLAAGLRQVCEDRLEADPLRLADVHRVLGGSHPRAAAATARAADVVVALRGVGGRRAPAGLRAYDARLGQLVDVLADHVLAGSAEVVPVAAWPLAELPLAVAGAVPARLPSSFAAFDQRPDDLRVLVDRLLASPFDGGGPLAVVGLRTSGSYLAPLGAAVLRARGRAAIALTARPSHPLPPAKRRALRAVAESGGRLLVTDDPPSSGDSLSRTAAAVDRAAGVAGAVVLLLALFGDELPEVLRPWPSVLLRGAEWSIHERLAPAAVRATLGRLGGEDLEVERLAHGGAARRGHPAARYRVGSGPVRRELLVQGAGLGYFGEHVCAVHAALGEHAPRLEGVLDGVSVREWLPEEDRLDLASGDPDLAGAVAGYVARRRDRLPADRDVSGRLGGEDPVWEVASTLLSAAYGRAWRAIRLLALDAAMRRLLRSRHPCVVDGSMGPDAWFAGAQGSVRKLEPGERAFSNRNLASYDAVWDLAAAAAWEQLDPLTLRARFVAATGEPVDEERWLVYQLVACWAARRDGHMDGHAAGRASARALQRYFAARFLDDVVRDLTGALCALDVDGVLETDTLGYPGLSPAGALALRALLAHGFRPLPVTGRSLPEVRERCRAYGLAGGVAEYGAAMHVSTSDMSTSLLEPLQQAAVERARAALEAVQGVEVGPDHGHTVRAWRRDQRGRRGPLSAADTDTALSAAGRPSLRVVPGEAQTDLVPAGVDKATGLRRLAAALGPPAPIALAVGDGPEDAAMLELARLGIAPANAGDAARRAASRVVAAPYQAGLALAVGDLLGHPPGGCARCRPAQRDASTATMLTVLGARESGPRGMARSAAALLWRARVRA